MRIVYGDLIQDVYIDCSIVKVSDEQPCLVVKKQGYELLLGGAGFVARQLGHIDDENVALCAISDGSNLAIELEQANVEDKMVRGSYKCVKTRFMNGNYQLLRVDDESYNEGSGRLLEKVLQTIYKHKRGCVVISDYDKGSIDANVGKLITYCEENKIRVFVDCKKNFSKYAHATIIKCNEKELLSYFGDKVDMFNADKLVLDRANEVRVRTGCKAFVVTRGAKGIVMVTKDQVYVSKPVVMNNVVDVTGAGDICLALLCHFFRYNFDDAQVKLDRINQLCASSVTLNKTAVVGEKDDFNI